MSLPIWIDGHLQEPELPALAANDEGFLSGRAVFETLVVRSGRALFVEAHLERLRSGARTLGIEWPGREALWVALIEYVKACSSEPASSGELVVRLSVTAGPEGGKPSLLVAGRPAEPPPEHARACLASVRLPKGDALSRAKSHARLRYALARAEARERGFFEALLPGEEGDLVEGSVANLFAAFEGELCTPGLERGALPGVVRQALLADLREHPHVDGEGQRWSVVEGRLSPPQLAQAREVLLTNSSQRVVGLAGVEDLVDGLPGAQGPLALALFERVRSLEEKESIPLPL